MRTISSSAAASASVLTTILFFGLAPAVQCGVDDSNEESCPEGLLL